MPEFRLSVLRGNFVFSLTSGSSSSTLDLQNMWIMWCLNHTCESCLSFSFAMSFVSARMKMWSRGRIYGWYSELLFTSTQIGLILDFLPLAMMLHVVVNRVFSNPLQRLQKGWLHPLLQEYHTSDKAQFEKEAHHATVRKSIYNICHFQWGMVSTYMATKKWLYWGMV